MWKVNMREDEYNKIQKKLASYHKDEIKSIKSVITDMEELLENDKDFCLEQTGKNMLSLLNVMKQEILPLVDSTFQGTEQCIETMITSMNNIDTLC